MAQEASAIPDPPTSRRHFIDVLLGASALAWLASIVYPIIRYLKPLPQTGPGGPTHLTQDEVSKLEQKQFVIVPVAGERVIVVQDQAKVCALSAKCTHEGCTVTYLPGQSVIWCPCHDGVFDITGGVFSGPPPRPLPQYAVNRQPDGAIVISEEKA
jgi:cytochrome b6-f complex iron-sulfur subunit